jgi:hypothetical protein
LLNNQCFAHGQLYVALSRVRHLDDIRVFTGSADGKVRNYVYKQLLDRKDRTTKAQAEMFEETFVELVVEDDCHEPDLFSAIDEDETFLDLEYYDYPQEPFETDEYRQHL